MTRITYLDAARGFAIVLVIAGHAIQYAGPGFDDNLAYRFIYAVHMPLFMFLAGFTAALSSQAVRRGLSAKARQLLVPFLCWIPISYVTVRYIQQPAEGVPDFLGFLAQVARNPDAGGLWFLIVLFECHVLLQAITRVAAGPYKQAALVVLALLLMNGLVMAVPGTNWLGLGLLRWYFLFFMAGFAAVRAGWRPGGVGASVALLAIYLLLAAFWSRKGAAPVDLWLAHWKAAPRLLAVQGYHAVTAFVGIAGLMGLFAGLAGSSKPGFRWLDAVLGALGARSLQIYAGHYVFLYVAIAMTRNWQPDSAARVLVLFVIALAGSIALARCVDKAPRLRTLLYGK